MDWPHDPDGEEGSEGGRKYGLAVIAKKLDDESFPLDRDKSLEQFGDHPIRLDHETVVAASELLEGLEPGQYDTREEYLAAVATAMRRGGYWRFERERYQ